MDRTGQTLLGKYELTRLLGKGGMGEVWEGEHQLTGRRVAVKVLSDHYLNNRKVVARFGREARAASSVQHEGIVEILDQDKTQDGVPFLVMEFLEGESVGARIKRRRRLSQGEALAIMLPLLDALEAAHQAGVVHRDLKPDNVFILPGVRGTESVKILDFGISQKADEIDHHLTQEGAVLGTPHYMSPEQARGEAGIDARADIYSAAVLLYECVVGDVPFDAGNYNALLQIILSKPPVAPRERGAKVSGPFEQVMLAALHKEKHGRPPTARALHDLLAAANEQPEDAVLDCETWSFGSPRVELDGADEDAGLTAPFGVEGPTSGVRWAPEAESVSLRESGEFDFGAPLAPRAPSLPAKAPSPVPPSPPLRVPATPAPAFEQALPVPAAPPLPHSLPSPAVRTPLPAVITREALPSATRAPAWAAEPIAREQPLPTRARGPRRAESAGRRDSGESGASLAKLARAVGSWLLALAAVGALIYVASLVFERPEPHKVRRSQEMLSE